MRHKLAAARQLGIAGLLRRLAWRLTQLWRAALYAVAADFFYGKCHKRPFVLEEIKDKINTERGEMSPLKIWVNQRVDKRRFYHALQRQ